MQEIWLLVINYNCEKKQKNPHEIEINKINCAEYGVPQNRKRVFFIAVLEGEFNIGFLNLKKTIDKITVFEAISDLPLLDDNLGNSKINYFN